MKTALLNLFFLANLALGSTHAQTIENIYSFKVKTLAGAEAPLSAYKGKTILIVNTASKCGLTPQYAGLQKLYREYKDRGFAVLAFPSNDFLGQEPGTAEEIKNFCDTKYKITFPIFEKTVVKGALKSPLYQYLTEKTKKDLQGDISWNFEKFLVNKKGEVVARFSPRTDPEDPKIVSWILSELDKK